ncbi:hypothetical protein CL630_02325 [bacterium]|nr:hypothetical protein [bacterium]|tara:strand:+ start:32535 stop:32801 length:267 start_codon:yes stop_codon:yes gene_type:complete
MTNDLDIIEEQFWSVCDKIGISETNKGHLRSFLAPLKEKSFATYLHSLRVGLLARGIGCFTFHEEKPLLLAGALHDLGKCKRALVNLD